MNEEIDESIESCESVCPYDNQECRRAGRCVEADSLEGFVYICPRYKE